MHYILRFCFVLLFNYLTGFLPAQELRYQFKNYTPSDGLPSSEVHKVLQDSRQYMWFATDHGVCRYNGYEFKTYNLSDNSILGLYEDYRKRIWAWSFSGRLFVFENEKWEEYKWNKNLIAYNQHGVIYSLYVDKQENVFISAGGPFSYKITANGEIQNLIKQDKNFKIEVMDTGNKECFSFVSLNPYPAGIGFGKKIHTYSVEVTIRRIKRVVPTPFIFWGERFKVKKIHDEFFFMYRQDLLRIGYDGTSMMNVNAFVTYDVEQIDGNYFFATDDGIRIENKKGELLERYFNGIPIVSIIKDKEGGIWFTSLTKGVFYLNSTRIKHLSEKGLLFEAKINHLQKLNDSLIIAGGDKGRIVFVQLNKELSKLDMGFHSVYSFYKKSNDTVYVLGSITSGAVGGAVEFFHHKEMKFGKLPGISNFIRWNDSLIFGSSRALLSYNLKKKIFEGPHDDDVFRASKLFINHKDEIFVGNNEGLWRYSNARIERLPIQDSLLQSRVTDIAETGDNCLLVGTRGEGLLFVQEDSVIHLTQEGGIISNNIRKIFVDKDYLWLATNKGVSVLQIKSIKPLMFSVVNLSVNDGLLSNEVNDIIDYGNKIAFASNEGISFIDRNVLANRRNLALPFYLSSVKLQNAEVGIEDLKDIKYMNRRFSVSYEALTYGNPGRINYRYRLLGFDANWIYTNNREVQFNPLPYGSYILQIQAKREHDQWDSSVNTVQLSIFCKPPFWATTWFWVLLFTVVLFAVLLFFRNRINVIKARQARHEELQQKISVSEQMALKAQMNPHFIFNSLNSIQQYVIDSDVEGANEFITGFSRLIRQTLEFSSKELISLEEEVSYLTTYLKLEKARMESKFVYEVDVQTDQPASQLEMPPLLLQPYVENALRHGIRYLKGDDGLIRLTFYERVGMLECIIEDNGIGRNKAMELKAVNPIEYQSRGMSLTAERIALLNEGKEQKIQVIIEDLLNSEGKAAGTRIKVLFPVV